MRNKFDEQLNELNSEMIRMCELIEEAIGKAVSALVNYDVDSAKKIMENDVLIDRAQKKIENICFNLLIQQQPVARDLRNITAAMKMVTDMERIGDHAADISEMTIYMSNGAEKPDLTDIRKMAKETVVMLNWSVEAYVEKDIEKAKQVIKHDDIVDDLFDTVKKYIIKMILSENKDGEQATDLLMVAKYFERIGDHATNIAEWVMFSMKSSE